MKIALRISGFPLSILIFCVNLIHAQTTVGGLISVNTHWTQSGSPYLVMQNILVDVGATLTIDPGTVVKFDTSKLIQVRGGLVANGTGLKKITFTSNAVNPAAGDWDYILFEDESIDYDSTTQSGSILRNCIVEYAGLPSMPSQEDWKAAIILYSAHPLIDSCIIQNNFSFGIYGENLDKIKITQCQILNNYWGGIQLMTFNLAILKNNRIEGNGDILENNTSPLQLRWGNDYNVTDNVICGNFSDIELDGGYTNSMFQRNYVIGNDMGPSGRIEFWIEGHETITDNVFAANKGKSEFANVFFNGYGNSSGIISKNHFVDNQGFFWSNIDDEQIVSNTFARNNSWDTLFNYRVAGYPDFHDNNFTHNFGLLNPRYTVKDENNSTTPNLDLLNNWWGTSSDAGVQTELYDWFDNPSLGIIVYSPFLAQPDVTAPVSPPMDVVKTDLGNSNVEISWSPNPESDIAGYKIYWNQRNCYSFNNVIDVGNVTTHTLSGVNFSDVFAVTAYDNLLDGIEDQFDGNESWYTFDQLNNPVGIELVYDSQLNSVIISPNPTTTSIQLHLPSNHFTTLTLFNLLGEKVKEQTITGSDITIDVSKLPAGIYVVRAGQWGGKFVKE